MQPDHGLTGRAGDALQLVETVLQRRLARFRNVIIMRRALHDAPDFLVDQPLRVLELCPHIGDLRMPRTIFAGQVGFVLGDIGILRAQLGHHLRGDGGIESAGIAAGFRQLLHLIELGTRLGGLHPGSNQLAVEIGDLLVVDRHALRDREVIGGTIVRDGLFGGDDAVLQRIDLAAEPFGCDARRIEFGADLFLEIGVSHRIGDGRGFLRRFRADGDIDQECRALSCHLHAALEQIYRVCTRGVFGAHAIDRAAAAE